MLQAEGAYAATSISRARSRCATAFFYQTRADMRLFRYPESRSPPIPSRYAAFSAGAVNAGVSVESAAFGQTAMHCPQEMQGVSSRIFRVLSADAVILPVVHNAAHSPHRIQVFSS